MKKRVHPPIGCGFHHWMQLPTTLLLLLLLLLFYRIPPKVYIPLYQLRIQLEEDSLEDAE